MIVQLPNAKTDTDTVKLTLNLMGCVGVFLSAERFTQFHVAHQNYLYLCLSQCRAV